jgi:hypothetical protein
MRRFEFIIEMNKTVHPSFRRLVKKQFDNIDKQYNAVSRMKRVVKGGKWWYDCFPLYEYGFRYFKKTINS